MRLLTIGLLVMLCLHQKGHSQEYQKLVIENANWQMSFHIEGFIDPFGYRISGDTVIENHEYKKVYRLDLYPNELLGPYTIEDKRLFGVIREDTTEKRIYSIIFEESYQVLCEIGEEILLYDFSIMVNDTLTNCLDGSSEIHAHVIDSIDYQEIWGENRKRFLSSTTRVTTPLIEGIGYEDGLYVRTIPINTSTLIWGIDLIDYCVGTEEECGLISTDIEEKQEQATINIYPNPIRSQLRIEIGEDTQNEVQRIQLRNTIGQVIFSQNGMKRREYEIWLPDNVKGLLIIEVELKGGEKLVEKIMKG